MDKLDMMSKNKVQENIEKIRELFPNAVTEVSRNGKTSLAVDFDVLKQEMSDCLINDREECYQFTWPDKKKSILLANKPISATLRPCKEESVYFENTQNLYIEGDNLDVLKLLQETYLGKIKMIYIDPPYNTGNDFVYNDDFIQDRDEYLENSGQYDEQGNRLVQNTERNGRFHTDWLNMIYPRLKVAKDLLADDGLVFISIDDNEVVNLKKICDEIFGASNYLNTLIWKKNSTTIMLNKEGFSTCTEYVLVYKKGNTVTLVNDPISESLAKSYNKDDNDGRGKYGTVHLYTNTNGNKSTVLKMPDGTQFEAKWQVTQETFDKYVSEGLVIKTPSGWRKKIYLSNCKGSVPVTMLDNDIVGTTKSGTIEVQNLLGNIFLYPKPVEFIKYLISKYPTKDSIILDFFSGSATTAHAVMQLNAEDGGNRKFIMVQLPEPCDEKSEAYKVGYKNICEIGKERIRRAGKKIKEENGEKAKNLDIGFRVFKLDSSNMKDVYYKPEDTAQSMLDMLEDNIKEDRTPLDLLFQVMLDLGKPLSAKIEEKEIAGKKVFIVNDDDLIACFDSDITDDVVKAIAQMKPLYAVFRDSGMANDSVGANFDQIFATYSPTTTRRVL